MLRTASSDSNEESMPEWSVSPWTVVPSAPRAREGPRGWGSQSGLGKGPCGALREVCCLQLLNPS